MALNDSDRQLLAAIEDGLPLVPRPYAAIGATIGRSEAQVIADLQRLIEAGVIARFGLIVRHHELGYRANAMVVWDVDDADVAAVGPRVAALPFVTLCYRRPRRPPDWPYNLYCMIHGRDRDTVLTQVDDLATAVGLDDTPRQVLFSRRRFKQRGARYAAARA